DESISAEPTPEESEEDDVTDNEKVLVDNNNDTTEDEINKRSSIKEDSNGDKLLIDNRNDEFDDQTKHVLPQTATSIYSYLLFGFLLLMGGITTYIVYRKKQRQI